MTGVQTCALPICFPVTIKYREDNKEMKGYDLDNAIALKGIRYFLENWRKKTGKSVKHWLITEIGGKNYENVHIHGILFTENRELIGKCWLYGYTYGVKEETYVNERTINYIVKYLMKQDNKHRGYNPVIATSNGIGKGIVTGKQIGRASCRERV